MSRHVHYTLHHFFFSLKNTQQNSPVSTPQFHTGKASFKQGTFAEERGGGMELNLTDGVMEPPRGVSVTLRKQKEPGAKTDRTHDDTRQPAKKKLSAVKVCQVQSVPLSRSEVSGFQNSPADAPAIRLRLSLLEAAAMGYMALVFFGSPLVTQPKTIQIKKKR